MKSSIPERRLAIHRARQDFIDALAELATTMEVDDDDSPETVRIVETGSALHRLLKGID